MIFTGFFGLFWVEVDLIYQLVAIRVVFLMLGSLFFIQSIYLFLVNHNTSYQGLFLSIFINQILLIHLCGILTDISVLSVFIILISGFLFSSYLIYLTQVRQDSSAVHKKNNNWEPFTNSCLIYSDLIFLSCKK